jgi:hypothetical protein
MVVISNWTPDDLTFIEKAVKEEILTYMIVGEEKCPTTGTPHLQGYAMCKNKHSIKSLKKNLDDLGVHSHWQCTQPFNTNHQAMIDYCKGLVDKKQTDPNKDNWKPQEYHEFGVAPKGQGTRTDLAAAIDVINSGGSLYDVALQCPQQFIQYNGGLAKWQAMLQPQRNWPMTVYWLWGKTGVGKSRWAHENTEAPYYKDPNTKWWCGYAGQKEVIIDDYRPSKEMPFNYMLALLDRYPMQVQSKHGNHQFISKKIFITCPKDIESTLKDMEWVGEELIDQFKRRITQEIHFTMDSIVPFLDIQSPPSFGITQPCDLITMELSQTPTTTLNHNLQTMDISQSPTKENETPVLKPTVPPNNFGNGPALISQSTGNSFMTYLQNLPGSPETVPVCTTTRDKRRRMNIIESSQSETEETCEDLMDIVTSTSK